MNILIVDDNSDDRRLLRCTLEHHGCTVFEARDGEEGLDLATRLHPDIIVSDALMPRMDGFQLLRKLKSDPDLRSIPLLFYSAIYTGEREEQLALSLGAEAFVVKPTEPEELWEKICAVKQAWEARQETSARPVMDEGEEQYLRAYCHIVATNLEKKVQELEEALLLRKQAENELTRLNAQLTREISERMRSEEEITWNLAINQALSSLFIPLVTAGTTIEQISEIILEKSRQLTGSAHGYVAEIDPSTRDLIAHTNSKMMQSECTIAKEELRKTIFSREADGLYNGLWGHALNTREPFYTNEPMKHEASTGIPEGHVGIERFLSVPVLLSGELVGQVALANSDRDYTDRDLDAVNRLAEYYALAIRHKRADEEQARLQEQLRQSQKMEAIGLLAGGIAHDFNNLLMAIISYGGILQMKMTEGDPLRPNVDKLLAVVDRAAGLTQSLLAFSRKQLIDLRPCNLNDIIRKVEKLLGRIIGEDIEIRTTFREDPLTVTADSGQIEQVLVNLATNARDAMPNGGLLSIVSEITEIDSYFIKAHGYGEPGRYALCLVTDSGAGMDATTTKRIFEPFFTTKELGKGTGLGLAVVYGIVKQHDGYINAYSEPGIGTTFRVYLPLFQGGERADTEPAPLSLLVGGTETILLAEDEAELRKLLMTVLTEFGYTVIEAEDGEDAVCQFTENRERIQLLLLDLIMPKKSGKDACDEIRKMASDVRTIFISGYPPDVIQGKGLLEEGCDLVMKPVTPQNLLRKIREVLGR
ncbi:MAG: response regulator [Geobacteraceae bacterium]|nr:response regulator [Geobacteraceae bacterium]